MGPKILSIDNSRTIRMIVSRTLKNHDCTVCEASTGEEGLTAAAAEKPDVILLDSTMPGMDSVTILARLREDPDLKSTPVIMLTAETSRDNDARTAELGVCDYLVKPFKERQLIEMLGRFIPLAPKSAVEAVSSVS